MPRRAMRKLSGGETDNLTDVYWKVKAITLDNKNTEEDVYNARVEFLPKMNEDELAYLYWEITYMNMGNRKSKDNIHLMREYLLTEFMDRKYFRNNYKELVNEENNDK